MYPTKRKLKFYNEKDINDILKYNKQVKIYGDIYNTYHKYENLATLIRSDLKLFKKIIKKIPNLYIIADLTRFLSCTDFKILKIIFHKNPYAKEILNYCDIHTFVKYVLNSAPQEEIELKYKHFRYLIKKAECPQIIWDNVEKIVTTYKCDVYKLLKFMLKYNKKPNTCKILNTYNTWYYPYYLLEIYPNENILQKMKLKIKKLLLKYKLIKPVDLNNKQQNCKELFYEYYKPYFFEIIKYINIIYYDINLNKLIFIYL